MDYKIDLYEFFTESDRKYLKALFRAREIGAAYLSTSNLSNWLKLHPATISNKLQQLKDMKIDDNKILDYKKGSGASLTHLGNFFAGRLVFESRIKELFLKQLGFGIKDINLLIDEIEMPSLVCDQIKDTIIIPKLKKSNTQISTIRCPHGAFLPDKNGGVILEDILPLVNFRPEMDVVLNRIGSYIEFEHIKEDILEKLVPGTTFRIISMTDEEVTLFHSDSFKFKLDSDLASHLYFTDKTYEYNLL